jgi:hypothetical protein
VRQAPRNRLHAACLNALGGRIGSREVRRLFVRFCHEVERFSDGFEIEAGPFDLSLRDSSSGFCVAVSPLRDMFLVSIGEDRSCDLRVSSVDGFVSALDYAVARYLSAASQALPSA